MYTNLQYFYICLNFVCFFSLSLVQIFAELMNFSDLAIFFVHWCIDSAVEDCMERLKILLWEEVESMALQYIHSYIYKRSTRGGTRILEHDLMFWFHILWYHKEGERGAERGGGRWPGRGEEEGGKEEWSDSRTPYTSTGQRFLWLTSRLTTRSHSEIGIWQWLGRDFMMFIPGGIIIDSACKWII